MVNFQEDQEDHEIMTLERFLECVKHDYLTDYDGFAHPIQDGKIDFNVYIIPSEVKSLNLKVSHIAWYNR